MISSVSKYERKQIAVMGRKNVGKTSLVNTLTGKSSKIVNNKIESILPKSKRTMELLPFGPLVLLDTGGIDNDGELGKKLISETIRTISTADLVILVLDAREHISHKEWELINYLDKISIPYLLAVNKIEFGVNPVLLSEIKLLNTTHFEVSCAENVGIDSLKTKVMRMLPQVDNSPLVGDIVRQGDVVLMAIPNDLDDQKRRQILPQIQAIKEALDEDTTVVMTKIKELRSTLFALKNLPDIVLTDNRYVSGTSSLLPESLKLTTFSLLATRQKGDLLTFIKGLKTIGSLKDNDSVLIIEACSHHDRYNNFGNEQIKDWLNQETGRKLNIDFLKCADLPEIVSKYKLIIHCNGCMLSKKIMQSRIKQSVIFDIPIVNYDLLLSYINNAIPRILLPFEQAVNEWENPN